MVMIRPLTTASRLLLSIRLSKETPLILSNGKGQIGIFTALNRQKKFREDPTQYSPAYNGHCANALSLDEGLIKTDGTHWEIFENKLYLFYAARGRDRWLSGNWKEYKKKGRRRMAKNY